MLLLFIDPLRSFSSCSIHHRRSYVSLSLVQNRQFRSRNGMDSQRQLRPLERGSWRTNELTKLRNCPGNVAVFHGGKMKLLDRRLRLTELLLRCSATVLALLVLILIATNTQVKQIFTIEKRAKYTDMKSLVFLVVANGITAAYSLLQSVRCVVGSMKGSVLVNRSLAWTIFLSDQTMGSRGESDEQFTFDPEYSPLNTVDLGTQEVLATLAATDEVAHDEEINGDGDEDQLPSFESIVNGEDEEDQV